MRSWISTVPWLLPLLLACTGGSASPAPCATLPWQQPSARFPAGSTFLLPAIDTTTDPACAGRSWRLAAAPAGNANLVVAGADGVTRFTPHLAGEHRFELDGLAAADAAATAVTLTVVDPLAAPFHNHNYYPSRSLALVGDELWVAGVFTPTIARLDAQSGTPLAPPILVGGWPVALAHRDGQPLALVAQRASDEIALVDVAAARIVDAFHVGDEPANLVLSPDGATAYVALATSGHLAVVDVAARAVTARIPLAPDLLGLAISADGARVYAARHRSGHPDRYPYSPDPIEEERDLFVVDTKSLTVTRELLDAGTTIKALELSADGERLYVAGLENHTEGPLGRPDESLSFVQQVKAYATDDLELLAAADLSRQPSSGGDVVSLAGLAELDGTLWVSAEGIDAVIGLDPITLAETARVAAPGRPRALLAGAGGLFVHGAQAATVTAVDADGAIHWQAPTGVADPRPPAVARGQRYFTGQGRNFGTTWSCNSCHADGLTDTLVWNAGPLVDRVVPRPFVWLEGSYPLGWAGYMYDVWNYAYEVNTNVGIRPVTQEATDLGAYLASLMPPPAANDATLRDGRLGDAARRGQALFDGEAGCAQCHALPLTTSRQRLADGITEGPTDVPVLVGAYRHGTWLKHGEARSLDVAVAVAADWLGGPALDQAQLADLTAFVAALTGRDFFVLATTPRAGERPLGADQPVRLVFSLPVWDDPENLASIQLVDGAGAEIAADVTVEADDAHRVTVTPRAPLSFAAEVAVVVGAGLESYDQRRALPSRHLLVVAGAPALMLQGDYVFHVEMPVLDFAAGRFDLERTYPVRLTLEAEASGSGARLSFDLGQGLVFVRDAVVDGDELWLPPVPVPIGPSFGDAIPDGPARLVDADGDGIADDVAAGFTMAGPGFLVSPIGWRLERPLAGCVEGLTGDVPITVTIEEGQAVIRWQSDADALAVYVTDPQANVPLGPGPVTGGESYWIVQSASFPDGFAQPVAYGVVPGGAVDAGAASMARFEPLLSGKCYKVTVTTTDFSLSSLTLLWP